jgi:transcriptional regulator with PAS, ATPase and Fis domain
MGDARAVVTRGDADSVPNREEPAPFTARVLRPGRRDPFEQIAGQAPALRRALALAARVARTSTPVLITGESGAGKELVAQAIHLASPHADGRFVAVNCAAIPDTLFESELFGHERGAFTGADRLRPGRFEMAGAGTLFLDEIAELPAGAQAKLLRVLQEREFERLGGTLTLRANARIIAATNQDLWAAVGEQRFRADLYYRVSVFPVHMPPLRELGDDVLELADHFLRTLGPGLGKAQARLVADAREALLSYSWPGNVRELANVIERALIVADGDVITCDHLLLGPATTGLGSAGRGGACVDERAMLIDALKTTGNNRAAAARILGMSRSRLYKKLHDAGLMAPGAGAIAKEGI